MPIFLVSPLHSPGLQARSMFESQKLASAAFTTLALIFTLLMELMKEDHVFRLLPLPTIPILTAIATIVIVKIVFSALHHAEIVGERVGEPLGTLVLTISVTFIEVAIITSSLKEHGDPTIARGVVFSAIMIVCNGLIGICLLLGGLRHHEQKLQQLATRAYLSIIVAISTLILILPNFTRTTNGPVLSTAQLSFISVSSITLYLTFLFIQTVRHRTDFIDHDVVHEEIHLRPSMIDTLFSLLILILSLVVVSLLAELVSDGLSVVLKRLRVPGVGAIIGTCLSLMLLLPESINAMRAASRNEIQKSLNIGLGSVIATIGLTVPAVAFVSILNGHQLILGLDSRDITLLVMTLAISIISFGSGRTNMFTGIVHIIIFANYIFLLFIP